METIANSHYGSAYFKWQESIGQFGGWANQSKFESFIKPTDSVLDFGCGGGFLLANLICGRRAGIEVNPVARLRAAQNGFDVYSTTAEVPDASADVVVSNHALEHCEEPLSELKALKQKLKPGALIVFVVPCETYRVGFHAGDVNQHLYSWSPLNLGNLFIRAGYEVISAAPYNHKWPPNYAMLARLFGRKGFDWICRLYARWDRTSSQVRVIARRPA